MKTTTTQVRKQQVLGDPEGNTRIVASALHLWAPVIAVLSLCCKKTGMQSQDLQGQVILHKESEAFASKTSAHTNRTDPGKRLFGSLMKLRNWVS